MFGHGFVLIPSRDGMPLVEKNWPETVARQFLVKYQRFYQALNF